MEKTRMESHHWNYINFSPKIAFKNTDKNPALAVLDCHVICREIPLKRLVCVCVWFLHIFSPLSTACLMTPLCETVKMVMPSLFFFFLRTECYNERYVMPKCFIFGADELEQRSRNTCEDMNKYFPMKYSCKM